MQSAHSSLILSEKEPLLLEVGEPCVKGEGKTVGVTGAGGHQENMPAKPTMKDSHGLTEPEMASMGPSGPGPLLVCYGS